MMMMILCLRLLLLLLPGLCPDGGVPERCHVYVDPAVMLASTGQWPCPCHDGASDAVSPWRRELAQQWVQMLSNLHPVAPSPRSARTRHAVIL